MAINFNIAIEPSCDGSASAKAQRLDSQDPRASSEHPMCSVCALESGDIAALREILIQDFFSLLPILNREDGIPFHASDICR